MYDDRFGQAAASYGMVSEKAFGDAVLRGVKRAQRARRRRTAWISSAAFILIVASFVIGLNSSPAFASAVGHVPGLRELARLVTFDKGLKLALQHEYFQSVGQAETKGGVTVNIGGLMADDGAFTVFWDIRDANAPGDSFTVDAKLFDTNGTPLPFVSETNFPDERGDGVRTLRFFLENPGLPDNITLRMDLSRSGSHDGAPIPAGTVEPEPQPAGSFIFHLSIDPGIKIKGIEYPIGKRIDLCTGAAVTIDRLVVYPTHARLYYSEYPANTKAVTVLSFKLTNERGETFTSNIGTAGVYLMESSFFSESKHLELMCEYAGALDKGAMTAVIDPSSGNVIGPDSDWLIPVSVSHANGCLRLSYTIAKNRLMQCDGLFVPFSGIVTDDAGKSLEVSGSEAEPQKSEGDSPVYTLLLKEARVAGMLHVGIGISPPFKVSMAPITVK